jgi:putative DNA primase/helicase
MFERFLAEATSLAPEIRNFLQVCAGLTLLGRNVREIIVFLLGDAGSGKTTLMEALAAALGEYAETADIDSFLMTDRNAGGGAPRPDLVRLRGKRMVRASEPDPNRRLDTNKLKAITGGEKLVARALYQEPILLTPMFVPWIAANKAPEINADDPGIWRRLLRVPMEKGRPREKQDPNLKAELIDASTSGAAVLAWAVEGLRRYQREGFHVPDVVLQRTEELRHEFDRASEFFDERCEWDAGYETKGGELLSAYRAWAHANEIKPLSGNAFSAKLKERGATRVEVKGYGVWRGVRLRRPEQRVVLAGSGSAVVQATLGGPAGPNGVVEPAVEPAERRG